MQAIVQLPRTQEQNFHINAYLMFLSKQFAHFHELLWDGYDTQPLYNSYLDEHFRSSLT